MQQACHNLSANSHICTSPEIAGSSYSASAMSTIEGGEDVAWMFVTLPTGYIVSSNSCQDWTSNSAGQGTAIDGSGARFSLSCETLAKVACCR